MSLPRGAQLGPYEVLAPIGAGGMGEVYRATDLRLHRDVAIKVASAPFTERSAREARLIAALNHPNICHLYDVGPDYLVMELVEGPTLAERLRDGPLPLDEALGIAKQIGEALEAAHEKGIVHRDLKPGNIKIRPDGTVKVLDFGLAKVSEDSLSAGSSADSPTLPQEPKTRAGEVMGTAAYMSPEQARGKPVDKRTDIWAFGVVLFEMLSGQRPFSGPTLSDILAEVLTKEPDWNLVPVRTRRLLRRCLEKDPKRRLRDIGDAAILLEDDRSESTAAPRSRLPWLVATGVFVVFSIVTFILWSRSVRHSLQPVARFDVDFGEGAALAPRRGASMGLSPDGSRLVFVVGKQLVKSTLSVRRLDYPNAAPLAGTEGAEAPFFSPDGKSVAFFAEGKLKRVDADGGTPVTLCDAPSPREGSWGDDDKIVFAPTNHGGLWRVSSSGGTPEVVTELDRTRGEDTHRYPQVLPGARAVLFVNGMDYDGEGSIEVQPLQAGKRKTLVQHGAYGRYLPSGHLVYMHRGTLFAAPMDPERLELIGTPTPLSGDIEFHSGTGTAGFAFSQSGLFFYVAADAEEQMRPIGVLDEKGNLELLPIPRARYRQPRISPDGKHLAITVEQGTAASIWMYGWANKRFSRFAFLNGNSERPIWRPDGAYLVFSSDAEAPGPGIYVMRGDGAGTAQRLVEGPGLIPWSLSAQPSRLAYQVTKGPNAGMWIVPLDWSDAARPKAGTSERFKPGDDGAFSSDDRWIAYASGESGLPEVLVRSFPGLGGPWQVSAGGEAPVWSRTRPELFYRAVPEFRIMVTGYSITGNSFSPSVPRAWSTQQVDGFDLMPDGRHAVVVLAPDLKERTHATLLLNFMDDLRRRFPPRK